MKTIGCLCVSVLLCLCLTACGDPVERLEIVQQSVELEVGETVQLTLEGYTKKGNAVTAEHLEKLDIEWKAGNDNISVDQNGLLTGVCDGVANVSVRYDKAYTRPITVYVRDGK